MQSTVATVKRGKCEHGNDDASQALAVAFCDWGEGRKFPGHHCSGTGRVDARSSGHMEARLGAPVEFSLPFGKQREGLTWYTVDR